MYLSKLPVLSLEKRIWGIISLWNLLASTPALFNIFNGSTRDVLENRELLMEVNFIDECCHIYNEGEHIHHYTH